MVVGFDSSTVTLMVPFFIVKEGSMQLIGIVKYFVTVLYIPPSVGVNVIAILLEPAGSVISVPTGLAVPQVKVPSTGVFASPRNVVVAEHTFNC